MNMHSAGCAINAPIAVNTLFIDAISDAQWREFERILDEDERQTARKFLSEYDRRAYIAAHALLRLTLSDWTLIEPKDWRFSRLTKGKPVLSTHSVARDLRFNISHTRGMAAVALAEGLNVGVDVETCDSAAELDFDVSQRYFAERESNFLSEIQSIEHRQDAFLKLWSLKEAVLKTTGQGITQNLGAFAIEFDPVTHHPAKVACETNMKTTTELSDADGWALNYWRLEQHHLALAVYRAPNSPKRLSLCVPLLNCLEHFQGKRDPAFQPPRQTSRATPSSYAAR